MDFRHTQNTHKHTHKHAHKHLHTHIYAFVCSTAVSPPSLALAHVRRDALATQSYCFSIILMVLYTSQPTCVCFLCDTPRAAAAASLPAVSPPLALSGGGTPGQDI